MLLDHHLHVKRMLEDSGYLGDREKVVVVVPVDGPIPGAALGDVMLKLRRENGKAEVAAGPENAEDLVAIARPIPRHDVVEAAVVKDEVEVPGPEGKVESIPGDEVGRRTCARGELCRLPDGERLDVERNDVVATLR